MRVKLGELGEIITGNTPKTSDANNYASNDIMFVKPSDISENTVTLLSKSEYYISEYARRKARILPVGSILVSCIGTVGKIAINTTECAFNQQINAIVPNTGKCYTKYVAYALQAIKPQLQAMANAAVVPILNKAQFSEIEIILPAIEEQRRIAAVLDKVTDLIAKRQAQLDKLDELVKSRFVEMFGDPVDNSRGWDIIKLKDIGTCKNGMNFHTDDFGVKIHCLGVADFKDNSFIEGTSQLSVISLNEMPTEDYLLKNSDIVFVRSNGNKSLVGRSLLVYPGTAPTTFSGFCIRFRLQHESIRPIYLLRVLKTDSVRKKLAGRGANIQNLNQKILSELSIPVPPLELQESFENFEKSIIQLRSPVNQSLNRVEELKKSLMQQYFK